MVRRRALLGAALLVMAGAGWSYRHIQSTIQEVNGNGSQYGLIFTFAFVILVWQTFLCYREKPWRANAAQQQILNAMRIGVVVPVYNEDPAALRHCLASLIDQSRPFNMIYVVDDGSTKVDYAQEGVITWFKLACKRAGIPCAWAVKGNGGKRSAQGVAFMNADVDLWATSDSDSIWAPNALHELQIPFRDTRVFSVAGIVVALNNTKNLLARVTDLWFVTGQLIDRSAMSTMGSVLVNSGPIAMYRSEVIMKNLDGYLNETFFKWKIEMSDDSLLTLYALQEGKAVQQPTAFAFTLMPETLNHHVRQYLRWMRGAFIRSAWRFKYLPLKTYAFWGHLLGWIQMLMSTVIFVTLFFVQPVKSGQYLSAWPYLLSIPILIGYAQSLRYLAIRRSDQTLWSQLFTVALTPLATVWAFFGLRIIRWYAMCTPTVGGWGTRENIELTMGGGAEPSAPQVEVRRIVPWYADPDRTVVLAGSRAAAQPTIYGRHRAAE